MAGNRPCQAGPRRDLRSRNHDRNCAGRGAQGEFSGKPADRHGVVDEATPGLHCSETRPRDTARSRGTCRARMRRCCATSPKRVSERRQGRPRGGRAIGAVLSTRRRRRRDPGRGDRAGAFAFRTGATSTATQLRWALEHLNLDDARLAALGLTGMIAPFYELQRPWRPRGAPGCSNGTAAKFMQGPAALPPTPRRSPRWTNRGAGKYAGAHAPWIHKRCVQGHRAAGRSATTGVEIAY